MNQVDAARSLSQALFVGRIAATLERHSGRHIARRTTASGPGGNGTVQEMAAAAPTDASRPHVWAIDGRDELDFETWMRKDVVYIDTWSLALDWRILLLTRVLLGRGAR
jgi:hypothetical protein